MLAQVPNITDVLQESVKGSDGTTPLYYRAAAGSLLIDAASLPGVPPAGLNLALDQLGNSFSGLTRDIGAVEFIFGPIAPGLAAGLPFIIPNNLQPALLPGFSSSGVPRIPAIISMFRGNSLNFLAGGSSLQFDQDFLGDDALNVVDGIFVGIIDPETEVADTGNVEQEVKDQGVYDTPQLNDGENKFILDLIKREEVEEEDEEEEKDDLSFDSTSEALFDVLSSDQTEKKLHQDDLDKRVNLEDTLIGEFDCLG